MSEKLRIEEKILIKAGEEFVRRKPFLCVGLSFAFGYILGYWQGKNIVEQSSKILFSLATKEILKLLEEKKEK